MRAPVTESRDETGHSRWNTACERRWRSVSALPSIRFDVTCRHCGNACSDAFCCSGCEAVYTFLHDGGLADRYYDLRGREGIPAIAAGDVADRSADRKWLEPIAKDLATKTTLTRIELDIQGVHCSACIWLFDTLFTRMNGAAGIVVNPAVGRVDLTVEPTFDLRSFVATIERLGYRFGPPTARGPNAQGDLVWRMGVCIAIAMNTMIFGVAFYCGLESGPTYALFQKLSFALATISVLVGGPVFFKSAWRALRQRALHLDLPIALGIVLAYASSAHAYFVRGGSTSFFDTIDVFIALMLVGRFLQERVVARNRASILASSGAEHLLTRRIEKNGQVALVRSIDIAAGDRLLVARGDLVPVDATLATAGSFSLDWISGESRPKGFDAGAVVPAGAFSCGDEAVVVTARSPFSASSLASLLRTTRTRESDAARATPFWQRLTRVYVALVLVLAFGTFAGWLVATGDPFRAMDVVTAVLIVTCPCAFGIATPLAYELAQAGLRRVGLFVRSPAFLDRAAAVRQVVFDKTGTLTTGALTLANRRILKPLGQHELQALYDMTARSAHPKSQAIARALVADGRVGLDPAVRVVEKPGKGLEIVRGRCTYRLGSPAWTGAIGPGDVCFTRNGVLVAAFDTTEELRPDAANEIQSLGESGFVASILSGDEPARVRALGATCGLPAERCVGGKSPDAKAAWVRERDHGDVLFLGDGINDALVADVATCSGTPAIDRPFMAARTDFYVVTPGLRPIRTALAVAKKLASVVRTNLAIAVAYNVVTVGLAVAGFMSPLLCAVLMPLASLSTVLFTTAALSRSNRTWKS
jgi:P-type Cu2+ transporter